MSYSSSITKVERRRAESRSEPVAYWQEVPMFFPVRLFGTQSAELIVRFRVGERLATTCFRGRAVARAGNFSRFSHAGDLLREQHFLANFLTHLEKDVVEFTEEGRATAFFSRTLAFGEPVGWESTIDMVGVPQDALENFRPNRRSRALRVRPERREILAPVTDMVTLVYELQGRAPDPLSIVIASIYPGKDVGELKGDITGREGRVFFDWGHPGA